MFAVEPAEVRKAERVTAIGIMGRLAALGSAPGGLVVLSGGNPALHRLDGLMTLLHEAKRRVSIETQGSVWRDWIARCDRIVISPKPPSSGMVSPKHEIQTAQFMEKVARWNVVNKAALKIVAFDEEDLDWAAAVAVAYQGLPFYLSAGTTQGLPDEDTKTAVLERFQWLCERVLARKDLARAKVGPQLHVLAWGNARAV